ncbi:MAG: hypothetical protein V1858_05200, partial [Candidatus Gottesmanbacteria bacterium]
MNLSKPRFIFAAIGVAVFAFSVNIQTASAAFPGSNGRIVFMTNRSGDIEPHSMNPDGSDMKQLTDVRSPGYPIKEVFE